MIELSQVALSLTYDNGLPVHYEQVVPLLNEYSLRATFYPIVRSDLMDHPKEWAKVSFCGHELGNHRVYHPCRKRRDCSMAWLHDQLG